MKTETLWIMLLIICLSLSETVISAAAEVKKPPTTDKKKPLTHKNVKDTTAPPKPKGGLPKPKKKKKKPIKAIQCQHNILKSYLLHGRRKSKPDPMYLCPTVKNNCCTKMDQQRIYHIVKEFLPQRLLEYQSKIRMALAKLRELHIKINQSKPVMTGLPKRRLYCNSQASQLFNFPFFKMYNQIMQYLDIVRDELNDYYQTFFCIICDADNHKYINLKKRELQIDTEFCKEMLENHEDALRIFNVDLINYLQALQNVVDCTHYVKSYKLEFFDTSKFKISRAVSKCSANLGAKTFMRECRPVCETLKLSKIIETIEGDFEFVIDAVNLFEKFFEFKESGSFISMKLRAFFRRFVVPRSQSRKQVYKFLHDVEHQMSVKKARLKHIRKKMMKSKNAALVAKGKKAVAKQKAAKAKGNNAPVKAVPRMLMESEGSAMMGLIPHAPHLAMKLSLDGQSKKTKSNRIKQRVLAAAKKPPAKKPAAKTTAVKGKKKKKCFPKKGKKCPKRKKKLANLVFNKELFNFYNELHIKKPEIEERKIFRIRATPVDIDEIKKIFVKEKGIDPSKYMGQTKFTMDQATLYRLLFNHVNNDKPDVELLMFLNDFTEKYKAAIYKDVDNQFKIQMDKKKKKGGKKRMLEQVVDLE